MADDYKPQQGDEAELFAVYNDELVRRVQRAVKTSPQIVEDAVSIAWAQFIAINPTAIAVGGLGSSRRPNVKRGPCMAHAMKRDRSPRNSTTDNGW